MIAKYGLPEEVKFCKRCVISNQRPNSQPEYAHVQDSRKETIHFDEEGVCDACRAAESKHNIDWSLREKNLQQICEKYRSNGRHWDCIVPGSGGKDSFFASHTLRTQYGMSPLLVTWEPHLYTDWGRRNLERWKETAPQISVSGSRSTHRLLTRLALENLFHPFQPFIIGQKSIAAKMAALYKIPLVFYGENEAEYGDPIDRQTTALRSSDYHAYCGNVHLGGRSVGSLSRDHGLQDSDLAPYMPADPAALEAVGVEVHYLGYYLRWHPQSAYYYAVEHGGFEPAPDRTPGTYSKYNSIDDKLDDLHYYTTYIKFGIGRATYDAAQEIRNRDITREEGVALVRRFDGEYPERFEREVFEYLSVPGFPEMTRERLMMLAEQFKSQHLWDGDKLRYQVE